MNKNITNGKIKFSWDIHWSCNYRCPYCWWHGRWNDLSKQNYYPGIDKLIQTWMRIYRLYGSVCMDILGGEPFTYPGIFEFLSEITRYHIVIMNTNLSIDANEIVKKLNPNKDVVSINATFHPLFTKIDDFIENVNILKNNGYFTGISYLAWPPQIDDILVYRDKFAEHDFHLSVLTFWGNYNGKNYPDSYTDKEKEIINLNLGERSDKKFQTKPKITYGRKCNAGHVYATIHPNGKVLRCGGGRWKEEDDFIGNIFDDSFKLLDEAKICSSEYCPCNEWASLLVEDV